MTTASFFGPDAGTSVDSVYLGGRGTQWGRLDGDIGEIMGFKGTLTNAEVQSVETYLKAKFNIP